MIKSQNWPKEFLKKNLIPDYRGLSVKKLCFFSVFVMSLDLYSKTALRNFPIFCISAEGNRFHCLSKIVFLKKFLISDYMGLSVQKRLASFYVFALCPKTALRIFPIFCMNVEDNRAHCLSKFFFWKNS